MKTPVVYIASPYSHPDPAVRAARHQAAVEALLTAVRIGVSAYVPIAATGNTTADDITHEQWMRFDLPLLARCDALIVLLLDGWQESAGVQMELRAAERVGIPIYYAKPHRLASVLRAASAAAGGPVFLVRKVGHD